MKKLAVSILFILISVFILDRTGARIMWWVNQNTHDVSGPKLRYLANDINEDFVIMGTSRANYHYVPSIIADSIGESVYNGGIDASNCIYAHYFALNLILEHHIPKMIILEVMPSDYAVRSDAFETTSFFAPYIGRSERADSIFRLAGNYYPYQISHLYRFNAKAVSNLFGLVMNRQQNEDHGYAPIYATGYSPQSIPEESSPKEIDSMKLLYMEKFIQLCHNHHIRMIMTVSPSYSHADSTLYSPLKKIASLYHIPFLDYHSQGLFLNHVELFRDQLHLWDKGAREYSCIFASDLKKLLSDPA